jgi:hypothetical protein
MSDERTTVVDAPPLEESLVEAQKKKNLAAIRLLDSWSEGDDEEQRETWAYLKRALDEGRLSSLKLFP